MKRLVMLVAVVVSVGSLLAGSAGVATAAKPGPPPSTGMTGAVGPDSSCINNFWTIFRGGAEDAYAVIASSTQLSKKQLHAAEETVVFIGDQDSVDVPERDLAAGETTFLYITPLLDGKAIGKQTLHSFTC